MRQDQRSLYLYLKILLKSRFLNKNLKNLIYRKTYISAIDYDTGQPGNLTNNKNIIEAFKLKDINSEKNKFKNNTYYDKVEKFKSYINAKF